MSPGEVRVRVPATTANLGPGFDTLGMALGLYNHFSFAAGDGGWIVKGCPERFRGPGHLSVQAFEKVFQKAGKAHGGMVLQMHADIPVSRGLGSSAACIVGGMLAANSLLGDLFSREELLQWGCELEGHPDNVVPALLGGVCVSLHDTSTGRFFGQGLELRYRPTVYALIPDFETSTAQARTILPQKIPLADAVFNLQHLAWLLVQFQQESPRFEGTAFSDKLHQRFRGTLVADWPQISEALEKLPVDGWFLSGSGPTIIVLASRATEQLTEALQHLLSPLHRHWQIRVLHMDVQGASLEKATR